MNDKELQKRLVKRLRGLLQGIDWIAEDNIGREVEELLIKALIVLEK